MGIPEGFDLDNPACPGCGGEMYDNRGDKPSPRSPDFKCKDPDCEAKPIWLERPRGGRGGQKGGNRQSAPAAAAPPVAPKPKLTKEQRLAGRLKVIEDYLGVMGVVAGRMAAIAKRTEVPLDMANVQAATWSVFGVMDRRGYFGQPAAKPAAAAPLAKLAATPAAVPPKRVQPPPVVRDPVPAMAGHHDEPLEPLFPGDDVDDLPF